MTSYEFLNQLKTFSKTKKLYFLYGNEEYFKEIIINKIRYNTFKGIPAEQQEEKTYYGNEIAQKKTSIEDIINFISNIPLFAKKQLVILRNFHEIKQESDKKKFFKLLPSTNLSTYIIITSDKKLGKSIKPSYEIVECSCYHPNEYEIIKHIQIISKEKKLNISKDVVNLILEKVGNNLSLIEQELDKLSMFSSKAISYEDAKNVLGDISDYNIFDFANNVGELNITKAMQTLNKLINEGEYETTILYMLIRHFRLIWRVKIMLSHGNSNYQIRNKLHIYNPFAFNKLLNQSKNFSYDNLAGIFEKFLETELELKSTNLYPRFTLEQLVLEVCSQKQTTYF